MWAPPFQVVNPTPRPVTRPPNSPWGPIAPPSGNVWVKQGPGKPNTPATPGPNTPTATPTSDTLTPNDSGWSSQSSTTSTPTNTKTNPIERLKEAEVMIILFPSQEKNLYGLGSDEDEEDYGDEPRGDGVGVPVAVVAEAKGKEEEDGQKEQANLCTDESPDTTAGQLMCPSHGKLCKKGICSGMARLVREEERKKGSLRGGEFGFS
ncbi:hypothetical protein K443DRAFT_9059 [Laccaria amethystina LaAM-08-1]|uniref:Uncharacterized protein n=1 Tax=Laccaria amethystina LaAM-08-1 TaxID=1095629 RepID=A0A0C9XM03_9AGAR|nr:hypothetical protein K443DRAFT_9059 [Laccaria amethystina LaAM-08-1]